MFEYFKKHSQGPYTFTVGTPFDNGAEEHGFVQPWPTPVQPANGTGYLYPSLRVFAGPQVYHRFQAPVSGLGGVQAGQIFTQPLTDNNYNPIE